jgi:hypothetical protein
MVQKSAFIENISSGMVGKESTVEQMLFVSPNSSFLQLLFLQINYFLFHIQVRHEKNDPCGSVCVLKYQ